ncbi:hypothetical protein ES703_91153 [subsurface metagenome]
MPRRPYTEDEIASLIKEYTTKIITLRDLADASGRNADEISKRFKKRGVRIKPAWEFTRKKRREGPSYEEARKKAYLNADFKCRFCGSTKSIRMHHCDGNQFNNHPENLIVVCEKHHRSIHNRLLEGLQSPIKEVTIKTEVTSSSAHFLENYSGHCKNIHGHDYRIVARVRGLVTSSGFLVDFGKVKKILSQFDHLCINHFVSFNPTAENLCRFFIEEIRHLQPNIAGVQVRVYETKESYAEAEYVVP